MLQTKRAVLSSPLLECPFLLRFSTVNKCRGAYEIRPTSMIDKGVKPPKHTAGVFGLLRQIRLALQLRHSSRT
jgi:hypothetical protein